MINKQIIDMSIAAKEALDKIKVGNEQYVQDKEHVGTDKKIRESLITGQDPLCNCIKLCRFTGCARIYF